MLAVTLIYMLMTSHISLELLLANFPPLPSMNFVGALYTSIHIFQIALVTAFGSLDLIKLDVDNRVPWLARCNNIFPL